MWIRRLPKAYRKPNRLGQKRQSLAWFYLLQLGYFLKQVNILSTGSCAKLTEAETRAWKPCFFSFQSPIFQTKALEDDFVKDSKKGKCNLWQCSLMKQPRIPGAAWSISESLMLTVTDVTQFDLIPESPGFSTPPMPGQINQQVSIYLCSVVNVQEERLRWDHRQHWSEHKGNTSISHCRNPPPKTAGCVSRDPSTQHKEHQHVDFTITLPTQTRGFHPRSRFLCLLMHVGSGRIPLLIH